MSLHGSTPRRDPLTEIVLCPTTGRASLPPTRPSRSCRPAYRPASSRAAAGLRSRAVIIDGARKAVAASGARITMAEIAARAGVAKATLYNHFRTREEVLAALLLAEIDDLIAAVSHLRLADALTTAALAVSEHPLLEALGEQDGTALAVLARVDVRSAGLGPGGAGDRSAARRQRQARHPDRAALAVLVRDRARRSSTTSPPTWRSWSPDCRRPG